MISVMAATFGVTTAVVALLVRQLLRAYQDRSKQELRNVNDRVDAELTLVNDRLRSVSKERKDCEEREDREVQRISVQVDKLRDKWERFIKEDSAMEATRGRKVEALFGVVDSVKATVRELPDAMTRKIDDLYRSVKKELQHEMREELRKQKPEGRYGD
jgi:hypothetical protein